ncbi:hypothetical protein RRG08_058624 [Elysia crispata]|uniref:Uncharacterized protein n=1 Tax=Elysia crispata TaxID=231223 RepID=A0AAE0Z1N9_9GAST|nr:hypothetical protein RRG08_058624 [Elysia crispata]
MRYPDIRHCKLASFLPYPFCGIDLSGSAAALEHGGAAWLDLASFSTAQPTPPLVTWGTGATCLLAAVSSGLRHDRAQAASIPGDSQPGG